MEPQFYDTHTHTVQEDPAIISIYNQYPNSKINSTYFSIGIHPWYINQGQIENDLQCIHKNISSKKCLAIGECGLDKKIDINFELQVEVLQQQIEISEKYEKPVLLHCVKSYNELLAIKKQRKPKQKWIVHGYHKNIHLARELLRNGIVLSVGASLLKNKNLQEVVRSIDTENFLLETDNTAYSIQDIYYKFAALKGKNITEIQTEINYNFNNIFTL
ncbi:TatD family hydrolase [Tenacibaculum sp. SG-28]|uniref:TatD family hydrolase n=1 Tax=Tenacibaculum sp. SG-28 TaxID=754426 RepID=UPI000CF45459|nr:TatD family hydrolase [Tenacibaculum sp. SG-28]PQJ22819.1 hypothetical protein BSU00_00430 [Tenacibaculum sp. SG-28]